MLGYSQFALKKLQNPNELVERGKYQLDSKIRLKFIDLDIETMDLMMERQQESDYLLYWKSLNAQKRENLVYRGEEQEKKDHECILDEKICRCKICGRCLKWTTYGIVRDLEPFEQKMKKMDIDYYKYESILNKINKQIELLQLLQDQKIFSIRNFTQFKNASQMRDFIYFTLCLPLSHGFTNQIKAYKDRQRFISRPSNFNLSFLNNQNLLTDLKTQNTQTSSNSLQNAKIDASKNDSQKMNINQNNQYKAYYASTRFSLLIQNDKQIQPPLSIRDLQIEGNQHPDFEIFGDFECANFLHAYYDPKNLKVQIILKADTNTDGFTSWFYFGLKVKTNEPLRLNFEILNCRKEKSLFQQGMNVCIARLNDNMVYSNFNNQLRTWRRDMAFDIKYQQSTYPRKVYRRTPSFRILPVNDFVEVDNTFVPENPLIEERCAKIVELKQAGIDVSSQMDKFYNYKLKDKKFIKNYFHGLSFIYQFQINSKDSTILFSQAIPYTFSNLIEFIENIEATIKQQNPLFRYSFNNDTRVYTIDTFNYIYEKTIIGASIIGLPITEIQITSQNSVRALPIQKRPYIIIIARQHPNETPGSFVCQVINIQEEYFFEINFHKKKGFIKFLLSSEPEAVSLRSMFIFKIIPMVNPDGVVVGNSRASVKGVDLNRGWEVCDNNNYPEIYCIKQRIQQLNDENKSVYMFLDLHGHTVKPGSFLLCTLKEDSSNLEWAKVRLFPKIIAENCKFFDISSCKYSFLSTQKNCCAREYAWRDLKVENSYTLETSFFGSKEVFTGLKIGDNLIIDQSDKSIKHFSVQDYEYIGQQVCKSILQFSGCLTLMIEQAILNEKLDIDEETLLTGQAPEELEIPQEELNKIQEMTSSKKYQQNLQNLSSDSSLLKSTQIKSIFNKDSLSPKVKKNIKSTSIALSQILRLKQMVDEKEKLKDLQLFTDHRADSLTISNQVSFQDIESEEYQQAITNQEENQQQVIVNIDLINQSSSKTEDQTKKALNQMKQSTQIDDKILQKNISKEQSSSSTNNQNKTNQKSALNKFQKYVLQTKEQIKVLFALKKGLEWNKFYTQKDAEELKAFKEQKLQTKQNKEPKIEQQLNQSNISQAKADLTADLETETVKTNEEAIIKQSDDKDSDSEPEDDCRKQNKQSSLNQNTQQSQSNISGNFRFQTDESEQAFSDKMNNGNLQNELANGQQDNNKNQDNSDEAQNKNSLLQDGKDLKEKQNQEDIEKNRNQNDNMNNRLKGNSTFNKNQIGFGDGDENALNSKNKNLDKFLLQTTKYNFGQAFLQRTQTEKIKLKSPFLPSQNEIFEAYSLKSPKNLQNLSMKKLMTDFNLTLFPNLSQQYYFEEERKNDIQQFNITNDNQQSENDEGSNINFRKISDIKLVDQIQFDISQKISLNTSPVILPINSKEELEPLNIQTHIESNQNRNLHQNEQKLFNILTYDKSQNIQLSQQDKISVENDYVIEEQSQNNSLKTNMLKLDLHSQFQKDYSIFKINKTTQLKEGMENPLTVQTPLQNSIYGGIIAAIQQDPNSPSQKSIYKQNSTLNKITIPSNQNQSSSPLSKAIIAYRPPSGNVWNTAKGLRDTNSPVLTSKKVLKEEQQSQIDSNSQIQSTCKTPIQKTRSINQSNSQPSFRIKQNNVNKAYKDFIQQQQNKAQKLQYAAEQKKQQTIIKKPSSPSSQDGRYQSSPQQSNQSYILRNSAINFSQIQQSQSQNS